MSTTIDPIDVLIVMAQNLDKYLEKRSHEMSNPHNQFTSYWGGGTFIKVAEISIEIQDQDHLNKLNRQFLPRKINDLLKQSMFIESLNREIKLNELKTYKIAIYSIEVLDVTIDDTNKKIEVKYEFDMTDSIYGERAKN